MKYGPQHGNYQHGGYSQAPETGDIKVLSYHLLKDFGVYKASIRRNFEDNDRGPELDDVKALLDKRTQVYTLAELERLFLFLWTAHDDCVDENADDYNPLQVRTAREKIRFGQTVHAKFKALLTPASGT